MEKARAIKMLTKMVRAPVEMQVVVVVESLQVEMVERVHKVVVMGRIHKEVDLVRAHKVTVQ